jgi:hypothetical protein
VLTFAFPNATTSANEQSFRMIVRPTVWGDTFRFRFSNVFGSQPLTLDNIYVGCRRAPEQLRRTPTRRIRFQRRRRRVVIPRGPAPVERPVALDFARIRRSFCSSVASSRSASTWSQQRPDDVAFESLETNYITAPGAGVAQ